MAFSRKKTAEPQSVAELAGRLMAFCARRDRSEAEARQKLRELGATPAQQESIAHTLLAEGFLNDARFAEHFVRDKVRLERWGRTRIKLALLQQHRLEPALAEEAMARHLPQEAYEENLRRLAAQQRLECLGRAAAPDARLGREAWAKAAGSLARRGYTLHEITRALSAEGGG